MRSDKRGRKLMHAGQETIWTPSILHGAMKGRDAPIQRLAHRLGRSASTVKTWFSGRHEPKASDLIQMMAEYDEVFEAVMKLSKRDINTEAKKTALRELAALIEGIEE